MPSFPSFSESAHRLFLLEFSLLLLFTVVSTLYCLQMESPPAALELYAIVLEYVSASAVLAVGFPVALDLAERTRPKKK